MNNLETKIEAEVGRQMSVLKPPVGYSGVLRVVSADDLRWAIEAGVEIGRDSTKPMNNWIAMAGIVLAVLLAFMFVALLASSCAPIAHAADFGATDLVAKPPLFPADKAPNHLTTMPSDSIGLAPVEPRVTHPAAVVVPATNKPIVLPAFKYPAPGSNQMWAVQVLSNRQWQTIAAGTNNVKTVSNRVWTTLLPFCLPAAGTLEITNKAPSAAYHVMGVQKQ